MKAGELAQEFMKHPDFDVEFCFSEYIEGNKWVDYRKFNNIQVEDIGWSDKVICIGGDEQ